MAFCVDFGQASVYRIKPTYVSSESVSILLQGDQLFHGRSQQAEQPQVALCEKVVNL